MSTIQTRNRIRASKASRSTRTTRRTTTSIEARFTMPAERRVVYMRRPAGRTRTIRACRSTTLTIPIRC